MLHRGCRKNLHGPDGNYRDGLQSVDISPRLRVGTAFALFSSHSRKPVPYRGSNSLNNLANLREGQLVEEISLLYQRVSNGQDTDDVRSKCAQAYLRELLRFKQESLDLLRYQRAGRGASWQRRPELHYQTIGQTI